MFNKILSRQKIEKEESKVAESHVWFLGICQADFEFYISYETGCEVFLINVKCLEVDMFLRDRIYVPD